LFTDHGAVLSLLALALIVTMPEDPPQSLRTMPGWLYGWLQHGLKTFVSVRVVSGSAARSNWARLCPAHD